jgi:SAM-dependent methyltransferase
MTTHNSMLRSCITCGGNDLLKLVTYKRYWYCCRCCGTAVSEEKEIYPLSILPYADLKKSPVLDEEKMYDYFVERVHIDWSEREGQEFIRDYLQPSGLKVADKELLDISGGNGHFIRQIEKLGARITLTEINKKTIEYARATHHFDVFEYNLNEHDLPSLTQKKFDIVFARACIMFARDLEKFVDEMCAVLRPGGQVMINHSVVPTLGVLLRTQLDEFSYFLLRQPEVIIDAFIQKGFSLQHRADETDPGLYIYDHDLLPHWRWIYRLYEWRAIKGMASDRCFAWPARDRRRSTLVFRRDV